MLAGFEYWWWYNRVECSAAWIHISLCVCVCVWDAQGVDRIFPSASPPLPLESLCLSLVSFFSFECS